ncbi:MAG: cysteine synthase family protein [Oscillospiraceae bacterium]
MGMYINSIHDLIGNTPLLRLSHLDLPENTQIFAKLELLNPGGSIKDRIGLSMIRDAEERGLLVPGGTIVEATAGNTGLGIIVAALFSGYRVIMVVPTKFSEEKQTLMKAMGAELVSTPRALGMLGAAEKAEEIRAQISGAVSLKQFENASNPLAHYQTTGPEIYEQLDGELDFFVAGAGSGGTFSGVARYLKERNPAIRAVLADPVGSVIGGGEHADYDIEGIGNDFIAGTMDTQLMDDVIKVTDAEAIDAVRLLARKEGVIAGTSSGAALAASIKLAQKYSGSRIVTIFPDRGERYFSKHIFA